MIYYFSSTYGSNAYTTNNYNGTDAMTTTPGTSTPVPSGTATTGQSNQPSQTGSLLANTGFDIALAIGLAGLIIVVAVLVRFWKRPAAASAQ